MVCTKQGRSTAISRYDQIHEAVQQVRSGELKLADFAAFINETADIMSQREQAVRETMSEVTEETEADFRQEFEVGMRGMMRFSEGLAELKKYVADKDAAHLDRGFIAVSEGNDLIMEAMKINRANHDRLEDEILANEG
ncbi:MAG: hypothetical protein ACYCW6_08665 [Candidatus Xenobia bacterium]